MTDTMINLEIDGRYYQAKEGATILEVARREGIKIPTLCYHEALESVGACRLCLVEITHADWNGWKGLVTSCLYPVEEGLIVTTDNEAIRNARKTVLNLLLARCPNAKAIRELAAEYGVTATSFKTNEVDTTCILCGLCVRVCAAKGCDAINMAGRGIEKRVSIPFKQPPPDCIGCASCAHICPTDTIKYQDEGDIRKIWGHKFAMVRCTECGTPIMPVRQLEFEAKRSGLAEAYFEVCQSCAQAKTLTTLRNSFELDVDHEGGSAVVA